MEVDFLWAPDGRAIAFNRWNQDPATGEWLVHAIGVAPASGGPAIDSGPVPVPEGALFDYAPDGKTVWSLPGPTGVVPNWQRTALEA